MKVLKSQQNTPVNIKIDGERTMLKGVVLAPVEGEPGLFKIKTGRRGRPRIVAQGEIVKVTVLHKTKTVKKPVADKMQGFTEDAPKRRVVKVKRHKTAA